MFKIVCMAMLLYRKANYTCMMDTTKSIIAILLVAVIFLSGALAGQYTGMPIAGSSSDLSANTLTVKTLRAPVLFIDIN